MAILGLIGGMSALAFVSLRASRRLRRRSRPAAPGPSHPYGRPVITLMTAHRVPRTCSSSLTGRPSVPALILSPERP